MESFAVWIFNINLNDVFKRFFLPIVLALLLKNVIARTNASL